MRYSALAFIFSIKHKHAFESLTTLLSHMETVCSNFFFLEQARYLTSFIGKTNSKWHDKYAHNTRPSESFKKVIGRNQMHKNIIHACSTIIFRTTDVRLYYGNYHRMQRKFDRKDLQQCSLTLRLLHLKEIKHNSESKYFITLYEYLYVNMKYI